MRINESAIAIGVGAMGMVAPAAFPDMPAQVAKGVFLAGGLLVLAGLLLPSWRRRKDATTTDGNISIGGDVSHHSAIGHGAIAVDSRTINQAPIPVLRMVRDEGWTLEPDGRHLLTALAVLDSPFVPPRMVIAFPAEGVLDFEIMPIGTAMLITDRGQMADGRPVQVIFTPSGEYRIKVWASKPTRIDIEAFFPQ